MAQRRRTGQETCCLVEEGCEKIESFQFSTAIVDVNDYLSLLLEYILASWRGICALPTLLGSKVAGHPRRVWYGLSFRFVESVFVKLQVARKGPSKWLFLVFFSIFEGIVIDVRRKLILKPAVRNRSNSGSFRYDCGMYLFRTNLSFPISCRMVETSSWNR